MCLGDKLWLRPWHSGELLHKRCWRSFQQYTLKCLPKLIFTAIKSQYYRFINLQKPWNYVKILYSISKKLNRKYCNINNTLIILFKICFRYIECVCVCLYSYDFWCIVNYSKEYITTTTIASTPETASQFLSSNNAAKT